MVSFEDCLLTPYRRLLWTSHFEEVGVAVVDNTAEDIRLACVEMLERLEGKAEYSANDDAQQVKFKNLLHRNIYSQTDARMGRAFLAQHINLIKGSNIAFVIEPCGEGVAARDKVRILVLTLRPRNEYRMELLWNESPVDGCRIQTMSADDQCKLGDVAVELARDFPGEGQVTLLETDRTFDAGHHLLVLRLIHLHTFERGSGPVQVEMLTSPTARREMYVDCHWGDIPLLPQGEERILLGRYFRPASGNR
jgi:hypothetical protein